MKKADVAAILKDHRMIEGDSKGGEYLKGIFYCTAMWCHWTAPGSRATQGFRNHLADLIVKES